MAERKARKREHVWVGDVIKNPSTRLLVRCHRCGRIETVDTPLDEECPGDGKEGTPQDLPRSSETKSPRVLGGHQYSVLVKKGGKVTVDSLWLTRKIAEIRLFNVSSRLSSDGDEAWISKIDTQSSPATVTIGEKSLKELLELLTEVVGPMSTDLFLKDVGGLGERELDVINKVTRELVSEILQALLR